MSAPPAHRALKWRGLITPPVLMLALAALAGLAECLALWRAQHRR
jgi:hypothetical protein